MTRRAGRRCSYAVARSGQKPGRALRRPCDRRDRSGCPTEAIVRLALAERLSNPEFTRVLRRAARALWLPLARLPRQSAFRRQERPVRPERLPAQRPKLSAMDPLVALDRTEIAYLRFWDVQETMAKIDRLPKKSEAEFLVDPDSGWRRHLPELLMVDSHDGALPAHRKCSSSDGVGDFGNPDRLLGVSLIGQHNFLTDPVFDGHHVFHEAKQVLESECSRSERIRELGTPMIVAQLQLAAAVKRRQEAEHLQLLARWGIVDGVLPFRPELSPRPSIQRAMIVAVTPAKWPRKPVW